MTLWIAAQNPPSSTTARYRVLGQPRIPTYTFPGGSVQRQRPTAPVGPSHTGVALPDELFQRVMMAKQERFGIDPVFCQQTLPSRQHFYQLAQDIAVGATAGSTGIPQVQFIAISDEIVRMVVTLLLDAFGPLLSQDPPNTWGGDAGRGGADEGRDGDPQGGDADHGGADEEGGDADRDGGST